MGPSFWLKNRKRKVHLNPRYTWDRSKKLILEFSDVNLGHLNNNGLPNEGPCH